MNKNIKKLVLAGVLGMAVCGSTFAAPRGGKGGHEPNRAKVQHLEPKAEHHNGGHNRGKSAAPKHHRTETHVVHHVVAPPPAPAPVPPPKPHHGATLHTGDWVTIGAAAVGGIVGGVVGALVH